MKLDYNRLSELLNSFGLSLKIENGNAIFVDVETNSPMKSYIVYKDGFAEGFADQEVKYITDANILLNGYPFYLENENKYFRLNIFAKNENIEVYEITKTERKEPHLYESSELKGNRRGYILEETTFRKATREDGTEYFGGDFISNVKFGVSEIDGSRGGGIIIHTDNNESASIYFKKDVTTGEIVPDIREEDFVEISQQEATQLIKKSRVLKDTMRIFCPILADNYSKAKTSGPKL